jgi:hypothetical protein
VLLICVRHGLSYWAVRTKTLHPLGVTKGGKKKASEKEAL